MAHHWAINGRFLSQSLTGVQRYAKQVVHTLDTILGERGTGDLDLEILAPPDAVHSTELRNIGIRVIGRFGGHTWEQSVLRAHARGGLLSLCNTGPIWHRRHIVCIHDTITRDCPQSFSPRFRALYRVLLPALGRTARTVATVSGHSADDLVRYGISQRDKIILAPNGHEHVADWKPAHSERTRNAADRNTILVVGSMAPHKNTKLIVGLTDTLRDFGIEVAVVGMANRRVFEATTNCPGTERVKWLGRVSDEELAALLQDCVCLAFPSLYEGFGLPPLEAMALGCPVVVSDCTGLPEVCGDAALYAPPDNPAIWLEQFLAIHRAPDLRDDLIARGRTQASRFRWRDTAERYLQAMAEVDARSATDP